MVCMFLVCILHALNQPQYRAYAATLTPLAIATSLLVVAVILVGAKFASGFVLLYVSDASTTAARSKKEEMKQAAMDSEKNKKNA